MFSTPPQAQKWPQKAQRSYKWPKKGQKSKKILQHESCYSLLVYSDDNCSLLNKKSVLQTNLYQKTDQIQTGVSEITDEYLKMS